MSHNFSVFTSPWLTLICIHHKILGSVWNKINNESGDDEEEEEEESSAIIMVSGYKEVQVR